MSFKNPNNVSVGMYVITTHTDTSDRVRGVIRGHGEYPVEEFGVATYLHLDRDDGQQGHGPDGTQLVPAATLEPYNLNRGAEVMCLRDGQPLYTTVAHYAGAGLYVLHGMDDALPRKSIWVAPMPSKVAAEPQPVVLASADPEDGYAYDSAGTLHKLNEGARYASPLPDDSAARKLLPLYRVWFGMFPAAMVGVAENVMRGNLKHLGDDADIPRHDRSRSNDHQDCILRHMMDGDVEAVATRAVMWLQEVREAGGAPTAPRAFNFQEQG